MADRGNFPAALHLTPAQRAAMEAELDAVSVSPSDMQDVAEEQAIVVDSDVAVEGVPPPEDSRGQTGEAQLNGFLLAHAPLVGGNSVGGQLIKAFPLAATVKCSTRIVGGGCPSGQKRIYQTCNYYDAKGNWIRKTEGFLTGCLNAKEAAAMQERLS